MGKELQEQLFHDMLLANTCMVHVDENGKQERVVPYSEKYWDAMAKRDKQRMENGEMPNPMHWPTELFTIEQIVEKYGSILTEEDIEKLKEMINGTGK